ncbi:MAG: adenylate/guanylate cyclase domain-containing protein [Rhodospirillales bacterium]
MPEAGSPLPAQAEREEPDLRAATDPSADAAAGALCLFAALVSASTPPALWRTLASQAGRLFEVERASLYLAEGASGHLRDVAAGDGGGEPEPGACGQGTARRALIAGRLVRGRDGTMAVPILAEGWPVGVLEVAGTQGATSDAARAQRLAALAVAAGIALKTVGRSADLLTLKSYSDAVVQATSDAVIGLDAEGRIVGCNPAALRMLRRRGADVIGKPGRRVFRGDNAWVVDKARRVAATGLAEVAMDASLRLGRRSVDVNASILPIADRRTGKMLAVVVLDDVSGERQAAEVLSRYLDPRLAGRMLLGGESRPRPRAVRATMLFCDLRNSTGLAEGLGAHQTLALLNEHFALMEECLRAEGGMIDKFIGDALLATFGILHPASDDEDRAVRAALAMTAALRRWNEARAAGGLIQVEMGIGINTDVVVAGNVGSPRRMDCTVIGAGVNVAARLEKACKTAGAAILATANTVRRLKGRYAIRPADAWPFPAGSSRLRSSRYPITSMPPGFPSQRRLAVFRRAFACKQQGRLDEAVAGFAECLSLDPADRAAARQLEACRAAMGRSGT